VTPDYGAWLGSMPWDYFLTVTFREPCPSWRQETVTHAVGNSLKRFVDQDFDRLFLGAEPHVSTTMHLHGLLKLAGREQMAPLLKAYGSIIWQRLFDLYGRSKVEIPRGQASVASYCAKYCTKNLAYYEMW